MHVNLKERANGVARQTRLAPHLTNAQRLPTERESKQTHRPVQSLIHGTHFESCYEGLCGQLKSTFNYVQFMYDVLVSNKKPAYTNINQSL